MKTYKVKKSDLKEGLEDFPVEVVQKMVDHQVEQGNNPNVKVFQKDIYTCKERGGFDWNGTPEGPDFWASMIDYEEFDKFFEKYPKQKQEIPTYKVTEADLKRDLKGFPIEVVQKMVDYQVEQGNKPDVEVFQNCVKSGRWILGFDWAKTPEGHWFWVDVIIDKEFDKFFEKYPKKVTEADLKEGLEDFPIEVVQKMIERQEGQGNEPDVEVFQKNRCTGKKQGGFDWNETPENDDFWCEIITNKDFDVFFKKYPKLETPTYKVTEADLIEELEGFPIEVVQKMIERQVEQGNEPDVAVFQKIQFAYKANGGFDWEKTPEKYWFWWNVLAYKDFEPFFEKYPKPETPTYKVTEADLKEDLKDFPIEVVQKMVERQVEQGYEPNVEVFQKHPLAGKDRRGFVWNETPEGGLFWSDVINYRKFDVFFNKYPKMKTQVYKVTEADLKEELEGFPIEVVQKMIEYQAEQGYEPNIKVFQELAVAGNTKGGFVWGRTPEGCDFWDDVITYKNFDKFFQKYPKMETHVYKVTKDDLKGELEGFPVEVVQKMIERQVEQGNKPDVEAFQKKAWTCKVQGGFNWLETPEGYDFWNEVLLDKDFSTFFRIYKSQTGSYNPNVELFKQPNDRDNFLNELTNLLNRHGVDTTLNTPDFIICDYIYKNLQSLKDTKEAYEWWKSDK